jgi:hypothetical protein
MLATVTGRSRTRGGPNTVSGRLLGQLAQQSMPRLGIGVGIVFLAVSGLFGGLQEATEPGAKPVAVGAVADGGPWKVTVIRARLVNDLPPMVLKDKGNRWIVVVVKVEIAADDSWTNLTEIVRLSPVDGVTDHKPAGVVLIRDVTRINQLNPGMPEELAFFWEQSAQAAVPGQVTVQVMGRTYRLDSIDSRPKWMHDDPPAGQNDPDPRAEVTVPVVDRRDAA